jgi:hypothetical protein
MPLLPAFSDSGSTVYLHLFQMDVTLYRTVKGLTVPIIISTALYRAIKTPDQETLLDWVVSRLTIQHGTIMFIVKVRVVVHVILAMSLRLGEKTPNHVTQMYCNCCRTLSA